MCAPGGASAQTGGFGPPVLVSPADGIAINIVPLFQWETTEGAISYEFQVSTSASFTSGVQTFAMANGTYFNPNTDYANGIYYWRVRAYNGTLYSDWSEQHQFEIDTVLPLAPVVLAPAAGSTFVGEPPTFSWEPVVGALYYNISGHNPYGGGWFSERVDAPATSLTLDYDLFPGLYSWYLSAIDAAGNWSYGNPPREFTLVSADGAAPDLYFYGIEINSEVPLRWSAIDGVSVYHIQVARDPDFSQIVRENDTLTVPEDIHGTYLYDSLAMHYWRVRAGHGNGNWGPWSETSSFIPSKYSYYTPTPTPTPTPMPTRTPMGPSGGE